MIYAGNLNTQIQIVTGQTRHPARGLVGGTTQTVWAELLDHKTTDKVIGRSVDGVTEIALKLRYRKIETSAKVIYENKTYSIVSVNPDHSKTQVVILIKAK